MDLTKVQIQLILLIKKYVQSRKYNNFFKGRNIEIDEKLIAANITEAADLFIQQRDNIISSANKTLAKDNTRSITLKSRNDLRRLIKNFAVYEIYKVMNPRRIAGETRRDNFVHNVAERGLNVAKHYTGGSKEEIKSYSPKFLKKLENKRANYNKKERGI